MGAIRGAARRRASVGGVARALDAPRVAQRVLDGERLPLAGGGRQLDLDTSAEGERHERLLLGGARRREVAARLEELERQHRARAAVVVIERLAEGRLRRPRRRFGGAARRRRSLGFGLFPRGYDEVGHGGVAARVGCVDVAEVPAVAHRDV